MSFKNKTYVPRPWHGVLDAHVFHHNLWECEPPVRFFWRKTAKSVGASEDSRNPCRSGFVELRPLFDRRTPWGESVLCFVEVEAVCASKVGLLSIFTQIYLVHAHQISHSTVYLWTIFGKAIYHMC